MKQEKSVMNLSKSRSLIMLAFVFCGIFSNNTLLAQSGISQLFNKGMTFDDLLKKHGLTNIKSGLLSTTERNDTLFAVFYFKNYNDLFLVPLGRFQDKEYFLYNYKEEDFYTLRKTNSIVTSKIVSNFSLKKEKIFVIEQTLGGNITLKQNEDPDSRNYVRIFYYSQKRGVYYVEYMEKPDQKDTYFQWAYLEGDFIF